jgi:hypothetical protein
VQSQRSWSTVGRLRTPTLSNLRGSLAAKMAVLTQDACGYHLPMSCYSCPWLLYYTFRLDRRRSDGLLPGFTRVGLESPTYVRPICRAQARPVEEHGISLGLDRCQDRAREVQCKHGGLST